MRCAINERQVNFKRCTLSKLAVYPNIAAALPNNSIDSRKSQPRPFADSLSRKKGIEDMNLGLCIHSYSSVGDRQGHIRTWLLRRVSKSIALSQVNICGLNAKSSSVRHSIPRVHD